MQRQLTDTERELLTLLSEECAEVVQAISKILRHGLQDNPYTGKPNIGDLMTEITDVTAILGLIHASGFIDINDVSTDEQLTAKFDRLRRPGITHHLRALLGPPDPCCFCGSTTRVQRTSMDGTSVCCVDINACNSTDDRLS